jgi:hypothetical protein
METEVALNCSWHTILVFDDSARAIARIARREMFNDVGLYIYCLSVRLDASEQVQTHRRLVQLESMSRPGASESTSLRWLVSKGCWSASNRPCRRHGCTKRFALKAQCLNWVRSWPEPICASVRSSRRTVVADTRLIWLAAKYFLAARVPPIWRMRWSRCQLAVRIEEDGGRSDVDGRSRLFSHLQASVIASIVPNSL